VGFLAQDMTKAEGGWDGARLIGKWGMGD